MTLNNKSDKKNKIIAFMSNTVENDNESEIGFAGEFTDAVALLGRKFNKAFKRLDSKLRPNVQNKLSDNFKKFDNVRNLGFHRKNKDEERPSKTKGIQCHECE